MKKNKGATPQQQIAVRAILPPNKVAVRAILPPNKVMKSARDYDRKKGKGVHYES